MKLKNINVTILLFALLIFTSGSIFAQNRDAKREQEHQAVKNLIEKMMSKNPPKGNTRPDKAELHKYDFVNDHAGLEKSGAKTSRKSYFMNGNKISTEIYNYGGIAPGYGLLRGVNNFIWHNLSYVFQFCPIVGAALPNANDPEGPRLHVITDGLNDYTSPLLREVSPDGDTLWQWQPLSGYADETQDQMASNPAPDNDGDGKPDSWPRDWYNPDLGRYVWPGYLSQDATNADLEVFWGMDDRDNAEFPYYPFISDSSRRGIGVQVEGRAFQWSNALAENVIFFVYTITNTSDKDLDSVLFGIYGDPDIGGGSPENTDDNGYFVPPYSIDGVDVSNIPVYARSMVYFWDPDMTGPGGMKLGYLGCKFLESPGDPLNGIDDDGDGMIDESQEDGIDNDGDWNKFSNDDVGVDGIPNTGDEGEGDGVPTAGKRLADGTLDPLHPGEPNFEFTDLDEADQIGLTSFNSWPWSTDKISNDESMWNRSIPGNFGDIQQNSDIVFIFGSGYISLKKGETKRISMALLCGENLDDLLTSAETVQTIYNQNYQFFKPPITPTVKAVAGDRKVTLYWDTRAEESLDPITGKDFEGYVIYRSTDPNFNDIQLVTDGKATGFLSQPLKDVNGVEAKWDNAIIDEPFTDLNGNGKYDSGEPYKDYNGDNKWSAGIEDVWKGYHPVPYKGRGVHYFLGNNTGLVHSYVDSNNVINGQTYYYAVCAYDHGDSLGIPPTETTKKITVDPITSKYNFDVNTVKVVPGPPAGGYLPASYSDLDLVREGGIGTGEINVKILNNMAVPEEGNYTVQFNDSMYVGGNSVAGENFSVLKLNAVTQAFPVYDTKFTRLDHQDLSDDSLLVVRDPNTNTVFTENDDYVLDPVKGAIRRTENSKMQSGSTYEISYRYYPVYQSTSINNEDDNPTFDGLLLKVKNDPVLEIDTAHTGWVEGNSNYKIIIQKGTIGTGAKFPADYQIKFSSTNVDSALIQVPGGIKKVPVKYTVEDITTNVPQHILTFLNEKPATKDSAWNVGEEIILFVPNAAGLPTETTWGVIVTLPDDSTVTPVAPTDGDVLVIKTNRPFNKDKFTFKTKGASFSNEQAKSSMDDIYVVPNPYVGVNEIEPTTKLPGQTRGERRIYFENLPPKCTIRIFTLSGELVQTIEHDSAIDSGHEFWNLLNHDGFGVAYGVYFAHIDAPGVGEKIVKFAIIK